jgi:hypothetical protein
MKVKTANFILTFIIEFLGITLMRYIFFPEGMWEPFIIIFRVFVSLLWVYVFGVFNIIEE